MDRQMQKEPSAAEAAAPTPKRRPNLAELGQKAEENEQVWVTKRLFVVRSHCAQQRSCLPSAQAWAVLKKG